MTAPAARPLPASPRRRGRGTLVLLAGLLAASGAIRIGLGVEQARALIPDPPALPPATATCPAAPEALAAALQAREDRVALRETALLDRLSALALAETALTRQLAEVEAAEAALAATLALADKAAEGDLERLTAVYQAMKPKEAAALFEAMAPEFAAGFLARMRPDAAAAILAGMSPEAGYRVSLLLAGRNMRAPTE